MNITLHTNLLAPGHTYRGIKRFFDILVSLSVLILLSPLLLLVMVLIKLESRGPVFYSSKRVGEGYHVFDFYKFRSMRTDADQLLEKMKARNQYSANTQDVQARSSWENPGCGVLISDEGFIAENEWISNTTDEEKKAFVKFKNDPRITRIGHFIRNTSMDELPQLVNVLKGDMSIVGNRPLPLYEASKLTSDEAIGRFLGPAGITGLWQVTERGKSTATAENRRRLDVEYAQNCTMLLDLKILLQTPLALFQQENV